jgi:hypothetical protein
VVVNDIFYFYSDREFFSDFNDRHHIDSRHIDFCVIKIQKNKEFFFSNYIICFLHDLYRVILKVVQIF